MESFEVLIKKEIFIIVPSSPDRYTFTVFNYATCHIIKKNASGKWEAIEHRFGIDHLPLNDIGKAINKHYSQLKIKAAGVPKTKSA